MRDLETLKQAIDLASKASADLPESLKIEAFKLILADSLAAPGSIAVTNIGGGSARGARPVPQHLDRSLNEVLAGLRKSGHTDRFLVIAYYYERTSGIATTRQEFLAAYKSARLAPPKNPSDVISQLIRRGFLLDADAKEGQKAWIITPTGERYVDGELLEGD